MSPETAKRKVWPLPAAIVVTIADFAATFFWYTERHRLHREGTILPLSVGTVAFALIMLFLTDAMVAEKGRRRIGISITIVIGETIVFLYTLMFLLLNVCGS